MKYRKPAAVVRIVNRSAPNTPPPATPRRWLEWGTFGFTALTGIATVGLAVAAFMATNDFNRWQRENAVKDRCISVAELGSQFASGKSEVEALAILRQVEGIEPGCNAVGYPLAQMTALFVEKQPARFDKRIVRRAKVIARARPLSPVAAREIQNLPQQGPIALPPCCGKKPVGTSWNGDNWPTPIQIPESDGGEPSNASAGF